MMDLASTAIPQPTRSARGLLRAACAGGVSIEYALLGAIIALGIVVALQASRQSLNSNFDKVSYAVGKSVETPQKPPRVVASTSTSSQMVNGTTNYHAWTTYTDGTKSMSQTNSNNAASGWSTALFEYDALGNIVSLDVNNPNGTFQYSETFEIVRAGVTVNTITDATGKPYAFQETTVWNGAVATQTRVMTLTSGRTDLWSTQTVISDYSNPNNIIVKASCVYGSSTVAC